MKSTSNIRHTLLATLMVFATASLGLQPLVFSLGSECTCDAKASVDSGSYADESSCCDSFAKEQEQASCCSSKPTIAKKCCCNPDASVCECGGCGCSEENDTKTSLPAIPTNETTEVVAPTLICAAPFVSYPREIEIKRVDYSNSVADNAALTSQQTCVLLSRFTC